MTEPDRLSALSQRVTALTGRTLPRDELVIVAGRAFEHQIDLDDDGQLRALLGGLSSGGGPLGGPPVSYAQPAVPSYSPSYPQAYPQPGWHGPAMAPGYPMMAPPMRAPKAPTRHPAGFMVAGILIVLAAVISLVARWFLGVRVGGIVSLNTSGPVSLSVVVIIWLLLTVACVLIALHARATAKTCAGLAAGVGLVNTVLSLGMDALLSDPRTIVDFVLVIWPPAIFALAVLAIGLTGRMSFGAFGLVTGIGYGSLYTLFSLTVTAEVWGLDLGTGPVLEPTYQSLSWIFLLLFGIAVSCGRVPVATSAVTTQPSGALAGNPPDVPSA